MRHSNKWLVGLFLLAGFTIKVCVDYATTKYSSSETTTLDHHSSIQPRPFISTNGHIMSETGIMLLSDARRKINLGLTNNTEDLEILKKIKVTNYVMRDPSIRHHHMEKKVMAQELEQVYPTAVDKTKGLVTDIFEMAQKSYLHGKTLKIEMESAEGLTVGDVLKLELKQVNHSSHTHTIEKIELTKVDGNKLSFALNRTDQKKLKNKNWEVFVYGRHVKDMRLVDYSAVSMLNLSATQALAKKVEKLEAERNKKDILLYVLVGVSLLLGFANLRKK